MENICEQTFYVYDICVVLCIEEIKWFYVYTSY